MCVFYDCIAMDDIVRSILQILIVRNQLAVSRADPISAAAAAANPSYANGGRDVIPHPSLS